MMDNLKYIGLQIHRSGYFLLSIRVKPIISLFQIDVITDDAEEEIIENDKKITIIPAWKWLLEN